MINIRTYITLLATALTVQLSGCTGVILNPQETKQDKKELVNDSLKLAEVSQKRSYASIEAIRAFFG